MVLLVKQVHLQKDGGDAAFAERMRVHSSKKSPILGIAREALDRILRKFCFMDKGIYSAVGTSSPQISEYVGHDLVHVVLSVSQCVVQCSCP